MAAAFAVLFVTALSIGVGATSANATTKCTLDACSSAYYRASAGIYSGSLFGTRNDTCSQMERKTSGNVWVKTGFHTGSASGPVTSEISVCYDGQTQTWHIVNPAAIYGLRIVTSATGDAAVLCNTQSACRALS